MSRKVYLSPSNQANNLGVDGVTEKDRMHRLAKDVGPILEKRGITVI